MRAFSDRSASTQHGEHAPQVVAEGLDRDADQPERSATKRRDVGTTDRNLEDSPQPSQQTSRQMSKERSQIPSSSGGSAFSPIVEETSQNSAPVSPPSTTQTASSESVKTVRDFSSSTPSNALRTPSYPFPAMTSPKETPSGIDRTFMALSPTGDPRRDFHFRQHSQEYRTPTSAKSSSDPKLFPAESTAEQPRTDFPSPNLYETTLKLGCEPGLDLWWDTTVKLLQDSFRAERATLSVPADMTDAENVPWGQKATFSAAENDGVSMAYLQRSNGESSMEDSERPGSAGPDSGRATGRLTPPQSMLRRPTLENRHSFAGFDAKSQYASLGGRRPATPRTVSYMSAASARSGEIVEQQDAELDAETPQHHISHEPSQDSKFADFPRTWRRESPGRVIPVLQALDFEPYPLIDGSSVNRVLSRGRTVVVSRQYNDDFNPASLMGSSGESLDHRLTASRLEESNSAEDPRPVPRHQLSRSSDSRRGRAQPAFGRTSKATGPDSARENSRADSQAKSHAAPLQGFEDFEQIPASPWSQSPAPSPAVRDETAENPFFVEAKVDEVSFDPAESEQDYSKGARIEAIGLDRSSTILHIPLIHPLLSRSVKSSRVGEVSRPREAASADPQFRPLSTTPSGAQDPTFSRTSTTGENPKRPIAILSILSPIAPYPQNLIRSLNLLAPHLATSFSLARHYSNIEAQTNSLLRRPQPSSDRTNSVAEGSDEQQLESLANLDMIYSPDAEEGSSLSVTGSVASPSEYSGRSKVSPGGSLVGTPAWEFGSSRRSNEHLLGQSINADVIDGYFQAKKRSPQGARPDQNQPQSRSSESSRSAIPGNEGAHSGVASSGGGVTSPQARSCLSSQQAERGQPLLHSYGADFSGTFPSLPTANTSFPQTPLRTRGHSRSASESTASVFAMPPPSERLLRTIIDAIPVQIFTAGPQTGTITWVNSKFLAYRGQTVEDFLRHPWHSVHPEQRDDYLKSWSRSLRDGEQFSYQVRLRRFDGQYRWFFVRAAPLRDTRGVAVHWFGTNMDIHEQHTAEVHAARQMETAASEAKYRSLANSSPQIVFAATEKDGIIFANTQWLTYSGQGYDESLGLGFTEHVHPDDLAKCKLPNLSPQPSAGSESSDPDAASTARTTRTTSMTSSNTTSDLSSATDVTVTPAIKLSRIGSGGSESVDLPTTELSELAQNGILRFSRDADGKPSYSTEVRLKSKDGQYRWHLVRCIMVDAINFVNGEGSWFGTCTDINDHKLLEKKMKETMDSKTRFLSNMSHEIRTPLIGISGMVEFLFDTALDVEQTDYCKTIRTSSDGLLSIVNDILDLSKIEAGMMTLAHAWFNVHAMIESVIDAVSPWAINKRLELNYIVEADVPFMVKGDEARIRQVLMNVLGNAVKFTVVGEVFVHCQLQASDAVVAARNEVMLHIDVVDSGPGFSGKESELIFKPFSQVDGSSTRQYGGSGLGLVISRQLVEMHGGKMTGTGVPGKGSTFSFTTKVLTPSEKDYPREESHSQVSSRQQSVSDLNRVPVSPAFLPNPRQVTGVFASKAMTESPLPSDFHIRKDLDSPALASSGSSDPSILSARTTRSERSSMSSIMQQAGPVGERGVQAASKMDLVLPADDDILENIQEVSKDAAGVTDPRDQLVGTNVSPRPPMYSILIICPQPNSLRAITRHIEVSVPELVPRQITPRASIFDSQRMLGEESSLLFTHIILNLSDPEETFAVLDQILESSAHVQTRIVVLADAKSRNEIKKLAPDIDFGTLEGQKRVQFVHKPVKPLRFSEIFDPGKERPQTTESSLGGSVDSKPDFQKRQSSDVAVSAANKGRKVLIIEDNHVNQKVLKKFVSKAEMESESALDGVEGTDILHARGHDYFDLILCDLHMPNRDGYQTCRDMRRWERKEKYSCLPIIALSANVMDDVLDRCIDAGFSDYVTKPVDFKSLNKAMADLLDGSKPLLLKRNKS
ncbi:MAG: hypothetical protein M1825_003974 [Sarcosagium campestre]|nr:MAG: hypothetical protein M1825_003974 [Sarcosagium campestre]